MQIIRTIVWIVIVIALTAFVAMNWTPSRVNFWPYGQGYLHFDWPVGFTALVFFGLGLLPTWLLHKISRWRLKRRISTLENSLAAQTPPAPLATSTQLESTRTGPIDQP